MYLAFLLFVLLLPVFTDSRSVYSQVSTSVEAKRVVKLRVPVNEVMFSFCSGVLLSERVVATAAHCLASEVKEPSKFIAQLGNQTSHAAKIFVHEQFNGEGGCADVGIMILEEKISTPSDPLYVGCGLNWILGTCTAYGYGLTEHNVLSREVREVNYMVTQSNIRRYDKPTCFMAKYPSRARLCEGDSGGPTICRVGGKSVFVAVTSGGLDLKRYPDPMSKCKHSPATILPNTRAFVELLQQIPEEDRRFVKKQVNSLDCQLD